MSAVARYDPVESYRADRGGGAGTIRSLIGSSLLVSLVLLATVVGPSLAWMRSGSMAAGVVAISIMHIYLMLLIRWRRGSWPGAAGAVATALTAMAIVLTFAGTSLVLYAASDGGRIFASLAVMAIFLTACVSLTRSAYLVEDDVFDRSVKTVFYILVLAGVCGALHISPLSSIHVKAVLFFTEPSHYALSFLPFLLYMVLTSTRKVRVLFVLMGFTVGAAVENLSLLAGVGLISVIALKPRHLLFISPLVMFAALFVSLEYYADRLDFSEGSSNFSALVFLGGWERSYLALKDTYGIGLGFQQFGVFGNQGMFSKIVVQLLGSRLNVLDGGTVGAKFIGEFGLFGALMISAYIYFAIELTLKIRRSDTASIDKKNIFFFSCFAMFSIDLFVRGVAYFSSSSQLFLVSIIWLTSKKIEFFSEGVTIPVSSTESRK